MSARTWFNIANKAAPNVELYLFDEIGGWGISARDFAAQLKEVPASSKITVRINSPGGNVFDGLAVHSLLAARKETVTCQVDGLAASIASVIALAGSKTRASKNALVMMHDPAGTVVGDSEDMRSMASVLDKIRDQIAGVYSAKSGKPLEECRQAMDAETWMTAAEAQAWGLIDEISEPVQVANYDLSRFKHAPAGCGAGSQQPEGPTSKSPTVPMEKLLKALVEAKLIPSTKLEDAEAAEIFAASWKRRLEAEAALTAENKTLTDTIETQRRQQADAIVNSAVAAGKIKDDAGLKAKWVEACLRDLEGAKAMLNGMPEIRPAAGSPPVPSGSAAAQGDILAQYNAMADGSAKADFLRDHANELLRAARAQQRAAVR